MLTKRNELGYTKFNYSLEGDIDDLLLTKKVVLYQCIREGVTNILRHAQASEAEIVIESLKPIQDEYAKLINDKAYLDTLLGEGAQKASYLANKTLSKVYRKIGLIKR